MAVQAGAERTAEAAARVLDADTARGACRKTDRTGTGARWHASALNGVPREVALAQAPG